MAVDRAPRPIQMVRTTTAVAVVVEAQCFAADVLREAARIQTLAARGQREQVVNEVGRLGAVATSYLSEFRALAKEIEQ